MFRSTLFSAILILAACSPSASIDVASRALPASDDLPPMKVFSTAQVTPPQRSNRQIATDFMDLSFQLESGRTIPRFTRFEGPISVRVTGAQAPASLMPDLSKLLARLRNEAAIPISLTKSANANITIEVITRKTLKKFVPSAACFVVPRVSSWAEYRAERRGSTLDWTSLQTRQKVAVFIPADTSPQEIRDCLHEEVAQGLGPLNDLYRLSDSVFNDDNFHTVLTGFDMLILRAYYSSQLRSGMSKADVASRLPAILARLNPRGEGLGQNRTRPTPRAWIKAVETSLSPAQPAMRRREAAAKSLWIAEAEGWTDGRRAFAHFIDGRLKMGTQNRKAFENFRKADALYAQMRDAQLQRAHVGVHLAAFALSEGDGEAAVAWVDLNLPAAIKSENAALLATLLMIKSEGLELQGRHSAARTVRLDSLGWARYGFGNDREVRARQREIASLSPILLR
ncbi:DUF2927 domain-containing protein [Algirhabdus cladophorae]|uniref:DUF2927 domain-containing protein n=1 Tax=Algirhabdus cladophorae TaxID=3377108 RepID=UPI003B849BAF